MIRVQSEPFDPAAELAAFVLATNGCGAIASFVGLVRGGGTLALELSHYPGFTEPAIAVIGKQARERFGLTGVAIVHRVGRLGPGEAIVFVATSAIHRRAAFDAVDYLMDRLKTDAPLWKKEIGTNGTHWVEARASDHADRARWCDE